MTIIAWDGETLAADTMATTNYNKQRFNKLRIIYLPEHQRGLFGTQGLKENKPPVGKCLIGLAGNIRATEELIAILENGITPDRNKPASGLESTATYGILVDDHKRVFDVYGDGTLGPALHNLDSFTANGSAWEFALGAMAAGLSAPIAVQLCIEHRTDCGYDMFSLNWNEIFNEGSDNDLPF